MDNESMKSELELFEEINSQFKALTAALIAADEKQNGNEVRTLLPLFMRQLYTLERISNRVKINNCNYHPEVTDNIDLIKDYVYAIKDHLEEKYGSV